MAASDAPFVLVRCTTKDEIAALTRLQYDAFPPFIRKIFMGCSTPLIQDELDVYIERLVDEANEHPNDVWIGVKDTETGKFVAGSDWRVFTNGPGGDRNADRPPDNVYGKEREACLGILGNMNEARRKHNPGPFVHLHICFTDSAYRRRGAGAMMVKWGCDLADQLFLPAYIEASKEGNFLYKTHGFYEAGMIAEGEDGAVAMKRDVRSTPIMGGKAKLAT
ncbi:hypothetical protein BAUCODRAFT_375716 [Baudoinia panamericana UAMH 10762]|uniref:N-acetyltransferase domain-containing protein n=1 Tax=Baudoinia panamericana (strain UAMH 10762) TaxID=717646 RepID=M2NH14_BAUPA|nr:uncharacterized protein BAUCODRAFT_375716 [Baudoinia panamericana UAMH 10762]EMC98614.1 hypothetical protein BAUCODRAFT_375716 [Baudoinia panamericana UAMH 10762]